MELRHLQRFLVLAEELSFARAAKRLHIEQPPLSRSISELEQHLGVKLFDRNRTGTRLTFPGEIFFDDVKRVFLAVDQASNNVKAADQGLHRTIRIAVSDPLPPLELSVFLAHCREEEPNIRIRIFETSLSRQQRGLREEDYDIGLSRSPATSGNFVAHPIWEEAMYLAVSARHPLLVYNEIPLPVAMEYRLITADEGIYEGAFAQITRALKTLDYEAKIAEQVGSIELMMTLVAAGYGVAIIGESRAHACRFQGVITRPIADPCPRLHTYLLCHKKVRTEPLQRLIRRLVDGTYKEGDATEAPAIV